MRFDVNTDNHDTYHVETNFHESAVDRANGNDSLHSFSHKVQQPHVLMGDDSRPAASVCIVVLCGLPGSGKTTFSRSFAEAEDAQQLLQLAGRPVRVWHVCYDRVEEELGGAGQSVLAFDVQNWQESRLVAMQKLSCLLEEHGADGEERHVVVVDDNMYYRSMRHSVYQLACRHLAGYVQVHLDVPLARAMERNGAREAHERVPDSVMASMAERLQPPDGERHHWERLSVAADATLPQEELHAAMWAPLGEALQRGWAAPAHVRAPTAEQLAEQAASRKANLTSLVHNADIVLRKAVGQVMAAAVGDKKHKASLVKSLTVIRKDMLAQIRERGCLDGAGESTTTLVVEDAGGEICLEDAMALVAKVFQERAGAST